MFERWKEKRLKHAIYRYFVDTYYFSLTRILICKEGILLVGRSPYTYESNTKLFKWKESKHLMMDEEMDAEHEEFKAQWSKDEMEDEN